MNASADTVEADTLRVDADERVGSVVFTDLVGFTEYNDGCGDDAAVVVLDRVRAVADAAVAASAAGRVVKEIGDGLLLWFDAAPAAGGAIVSFVDAIADLRACDEFPLAVRVGVHHGPVRPRGDDLVGQTVNIAARIVDLAGPMEILVSEAFADVCGVLPAAATFEPIGPATVKGVAETLWLHRVANRSFSGSSVPDSGTQTPESLRVPMGRAGPRRRG